MLKIKIGSIKLWWLFAIWIFIIILIAIGSFADLEISKAIASDTTFFPTLIEQVGQTFGYAMIPIGAAMISSLFLRKQSSKGAKIIVISLSVISLIASSFLMGGDFAGQLGYSWILPKWLGILIAFIIYSIIYIIAFFAIDVNKPTRKIITNGIIIILSVVLPIILSFFVLKEMAFRPRFRAMAWDNSYWGTTAVGLDKFQNWWEFNFFKKPDWFTSLSSPLPNDYIKSWPSGHSLNAACTLSIPLFITCCKNTTTKHESFWFLIAVLHSFIVAFSRVFKGAHFLSDIGFGLLLGSLLPFIIYCIGYKISYKKVFTKE